MNKFIALAVLLFAILPLKAQVFDPSMAGGGGQFENPVNWEASFEKENATKLQNSHHHSSQSLCGRLYKPSLQGGAD